MVQSAFPAKALLSRLQAVFDDSHAAAITSAPNHPGGSFRNGMPQVFTLMVHETDGWPSRNKAQKWVKNYTKSPGDGTGPQTAVFYDGTVIKVMGYPLLAWHGEFLNARSLGTETGHGTDARNEGGNVAKNDPPPDIAPDTTAGGTVRKGWHALSTDAEDVPGAKLFCCDQTSDTPPEVLICWWSSSLYTTRTQADFLIPTRDPPGATPLTPQNYPNHIIALPPHPALMVFSEAQYRSHSLLARYFCEAFLVPRNLPLYPWTNREHALRSPSGGGSPKFRQIVLADANFTTIRDDLTANVASFSAANNLGNTIFADANLAAFRTAYNNANVAANTVTEQIFHLTNNNKAPLNKAWLYMFKSFRGVIGHGFAGATVLDDHDCPGPMFDWYRFARELYDWWWYPFDFDAAFATTATPVRAILTPRSRGTTADPGDETPLIEHFWENTPTDGRPDPYLGRAAQPGGLLGQTASPQTFRLEANSPIYAMANGELVAARILTPGVGVNMSLVLIRHEIFHQADPSGWQAILGNLTGSPPPANVATLGRIDYTVEPTSVYSLYMHLAGGDQVSFDAPIAANPTWLNRVLVRKKECDLAIDSAGALNPALQAMPAADFTAPPPAGRPDPITLLRLDKDRLTTFLNHLRAGDVAPAPVRGAADNFGPSPIKVLLSDYLGTAGVTRVTGGAPTTGVLVEVFSPGVVNALAFPEVLNKTSWDPGTATTPMIRYVSEWARALTAQESAAATAAGADPNLMRWWSDAISNQIPQVGLAAGDKVPASGLVYHYAPLDFMRGLNGVTWASEWPKYRVTDGGANVDRPDQPRARRL
jgi:hypothetical protein